MGAPSGCRSCDLDYFERRSRRPAMFHRLCPVSRSPMLSVRFPVLRGRRGVRRRVQLLPRRLVKLTALLSRRHPRDQRWILRSQWVPILRQRQILCDRPLRQPLRKRVLSVKERAGRAAGGVWPPRVTAKTLQKRTAHGVPEAASIQSVECIHIIRMTACRRFQWE